MFKDMTLSRELSRFFCDSPDYASAIQQIPFEFNAQVLTSGFWPNYPDSKVKPNVLESSSNSTAKACSMADN